MEDHARGNTVEMDKKRLDKNKAKTMVAVIDVNLFFLPSEPKVVIKELAVKCITDPDSRNYLFKPPVNLLYPKAYVEKGRHGIEWDDGEVDYEKLGKILEELRNIYRYVYSRGHRKCEILQGFCKFPVYDLKELGCESLGELKNKWKIPMECSYHPDISYSCAYQRAFLLKRWCIHHRDEIDLISNYEARLKTFSGSLNSAMLAGYGFVHMTGTVLGIRCVFCGFENPELSHGEDPQQKHFYEKPYCPSFAFFY